jgi:ABC-type multidrug transport system ATPase subunit
VQEPTPCGTSTTTILKNVSFDIAPGTCLAVVGLPGSGAKALLNILGGWRMPGVLTAEAVSEPRPREVGYVAQEDIFPPLESPREILSYYSRWASAWDRFLLMGNFAYNLTRRLVHIRLYH